MPLQTGTDFADFASCRATASLQHLATLLLQYGTREPDIFLAPKCRRESPSATTRNNTEIAWACLDIIGLSWMMFLVMLLQSLYVLCLLVRCFSFSHCIFGILMHFSNSAGGSARSKKRRRCSAWECGWEGRRHQPHLKDKSISHLPHLPHLPHLTCFLHPSN